MSAPPKSSFIRKSKQPTTSAVQSTDQQSSDQGQKVEQVANQTESVDTSNQPQQQQSISNDQQQSISNDSNKQESSSNSNSNSNQTNAQNRTTNQSQPSTIDRKVESSNYTENSPNLTGTRPLALNSQLAISSGLFELDGMKI